MQIGTTELIIIVIILVIAFGVYRAKPSSSTNSPPDREKQQAGKEPADDATSGTGQSESTGTKAGSPKASRPKDPYAVLNIPTNATQDEVTAAYRKLAQMYHPDKVAGLAPEYQEIAQRKMKDINAAYAATLPKMKR